MIKELRIVTGFLPELARFMELDYSVKGDYFEGNTQCVRTLCHKVLEQSQKFDRP
jgi:hypothetical protein